MENVIQSDLPRDEWLTPLQVDVTPFLRLHERDDLCTPPDLDV
jgi:hypothetical protein